MYVSLRLKKLTLVAASVILCAVVAAGGCALYAVAREGEEEPQAQKDFIKWVDFGPTYEAMDKAMRLDIQSQTEEVKLNWIELLAYQALQNGGNFKSFKASQLDVVADKLRKGVTMEELTESGKKYYDYYLEAYTAVLGEFVGEYEIEVKDEASPTGKRWEKKYGLKVFFPIAKGYGYSHYDDFGNSRSYGFRRKHLGNDILGYIGTPIIAVEGGTVEALGWNQYGGWRIGIRSFDKKRYYYYAHLRKNFPFNKSLEEGSIVKAGDVIGYLGRTGYSTEENVNNITQNHLHFGIQLIFDESQKEGNNEIWIDCYQIVKLLSRNRSAVWKNVETKEYSRVYDIRDPEYPADIQPRTAPPPTTTQPTTAPATQPETEQPATGEKGQKAAGPPQNAQQQPSGTAAAGQGP